MRIAKYFFHVTIILRSKNGLFVEKSDISNVDFDSQYHFWYLDSKIILIWFELGLWLE